MLYIEEPDFQKISNDKRNCYDIQTHQCGWVDHRFTHEKCSNSYRLICDWLSYLSSLLVLQKLRYRLESCTGFGRGSGDWIGSGRTFEKGLVQNVEELPFDTALKITVAKYYTPSGRCIQSANYKEGRGSGMTDANSGFLAKKVSEKETIGFVFMHHSSKIWSLDFVNIT